MSSDRLSAIGTNTRGSFLFRVSIVAAVLSCLLMYVSLVVFSAGIEKLEDVFAALSVFFAFLMSAAVPAIAISLCVTFALGAPLWSLCRMRPDCSAFEAVRFGALCGAIIALVELGFALYQLHANGRQSTSLMFWGVNLSGETSAPSVMGWLKLAFDLACTIGIGALSARIAWRRPTPPARTRNNPSPAQTPRPQ